MNLSRPRTFQQKAKTILSNISTLAAAGAIALGSANGHAATNTFGPDNPFYAPSTLPFQAPAFDKIKDSDYQPALEAGMDEQIKEVEAIANNSARPTFENTLVALEKTGVLFNRVMAVFNGVTGANTNPELQKVQTIEAPKLAAHQDAIFLSAKLFARIKAVYDERATLKLDPESLRLVEWDYTEFVHNGAALSDGDKAQLKKLNEEESTLSNDFIMKLLAATKAAAYSTTDEAALKGLSEAQMAAAQQAAQGRKQQGWVLPLQNTTQQPDLAALADRATRKALFDDSWTRAERGDANDTRSTIARLAQIRAEKAKLLGFPSYAAWNLQDQMAKTPENALKFLNALVPAATAKAAGEAKDIQALIDSQNGGFKLEAWDWEFYSEQVRKAKYDLD
jgi:peptidyl-dipeptidase Dcp